MKKIPVAIVGLEPGTPGSAVQHFNHLATKVNACKAYNVIGTLMCVHVVDRNRQKKVILPGLVQPTCMSIDGHKIPFSYCQ